MMLREHLYSYTIGICNRYFKNNYYDIMKLKLYSQTFTDLLFS